MFGVQLWNVICHRKVMCYILFEKLHYRKQQISADAAADPDLF